MVVEKVKYSIENKNEEVLLTGSIIIPKGEYTEFKISNLRIRICFENESSNEDGNQKAGRIESRLDTDNEGEYLLLTLYNQTGAFYSGLNEPAKIAQLGGHPLNLIFSIVDIHSGNSKLLFYTWTLGKAKDNSIINEKTNQ